MRQTTRDCWPFLPVSCAAAGANIAGAHITTTRDGYALDTFLLNREFQEDEDELRRADRISNTIQRLLNGHDRLPALLDTAAARAGEAAVPLRSSPKSSSTMGYRSGSRVVEVAGRDRPGLLYDLTSALSDLSLDIASAHITTFGEKAVDVFYVTDLTGKQIVSEARQRTIRARLQSILAGDERAKAVPGMVGS